MSIASEITRINTNITNSYTAISNKGGTLPATQNSNNLATAINSIPSGGGATLITKTITGNKTYNAQDDNADGYSSVNVELFFQDNGLPYFKNMIFSNDVTSTTVVFSSCTYLETVKYEAGVTNLSNSLFRNCINLKEVELPNTLTTIQSRAFQSCSSLSTINFPNSLTSIPSGNQPFQSCTSLENVTIENGFNCNYLNLSSSTNYSVETMVSWFNALADRTGDTAYTFTIGATNLNKLTAEQKAIATNKNWTLA